MASKNSCKFKNICGSCDKSYASYEDSLAHKDSFVKSLLKDKVDNIYPIIPCEARNNYRNKVHAAFEYKRGRILAGLYQESSHQIVEVVDCLLQDERANRIIKSIHELAIKWKITIYNERSRQGVLRRVLVRTADEEIMVVLVIGNHVFPGKAGFIKELRRLHPEITTILININTRTDSMILGDKTSVAYGKGFIIDSLLQNRFKISATSFYQINKRQAEILYSTAIKFANLRPSDKVIDAYCGIGTIGLSFSSKVREVIGIEQNPDAIRDAKFNASLNNISNIRFIGGDATRIMCEMAKNSEKVDVVILDPPRSGTTKEFIDACKRLNPRTIVYVSCDPTTLARDVALMEKLDYHAEDLVPVDMFPWTNHIECVVLMSRVDK